MVKIKRKVQKNLPQLIEWTWDNGIDSRTFKSPKGGDITFDEYGGVVDVYSIKPNDTFTVEVEEVVDEDTKLPQSLAIFEHNGKLYSEMHENKNINDILKMDIKVKSSSTKTIHMVNDDGTHTLIWRDGKLVE